nr:MAG TPA_asm: hypothetical protein [Caudoviricetes sp.]
MRLFLIVFIYIAPMTITLISSSCYRHIVILVS